MSDITTILQVAVGEEPPLNLDPATVLGRAERARQSRRRRRAASLGTAAGAGAVAVVVAAVSLTGGGAPAVTPRAHRGSAAMSLAALETAAARTSSTPTVTGLRPGQSRVTVDGIAARRLAALVQRDAGVRLAQVNVSVLATGGAPGHRGGRFLDLGAGIAVKGKPYLNVQVTPAGTMITTTPTCAELSDLSSGSGDGYYGPCHITRLAGGSLLIVRSGRTRAGAFTMAQATLIRPDGSGFFAEDTNQAWVSPSAMASRKAAKHPVAKDGQRPAAKPGLPPVVSPEPPVGAGILAQLVHDLAALSQR
jgi:hypothetical protein